MQDYYKSKIIELSKLTTAKLAPSPTGPSVVSFVVKIVDAVVVVVDSEVTG